jgi:hypothetical protein
VPPAREAECVAVIEVCLASEAHRGGWAGMETMQAQLRVELGLHIRFSEVSRLLNVVSSRQELARIDTKGAGRVARPLFRTAADEALPTTDAALLVDGQLPRVVRFLARVPPAREEECVAAIEASLASEARCGGWAGMETLLAQLRTQLGLAVPATELTSLLDLVAARRRLVRLILSRHSVARFTTVSYRVEECPARFCVRLADDEGLPTTDAALLLIQGRAPRAAPLRGAATPGVAVAAGAARHEPHSGVGRPVT